MLDEQRQQDLDRKIAEKKALEDQGEYFIFVNDVFTLIHLLFREKNRKCSNERKRRIRKGRSEEK